MILDYTIKGQVKIDMRHYVSDMLSSFPEIIRPENVANYPANENLFGQKYSSHIKLPKDKAEVFHTFVAKGLFLTKRA